WANAFSSAELDRIEALGDRLTAEKATLASAAPEGAVRGEIRVTQTAWLAPTPETKWIYDRVQGVARSLNDRVYQFDLSGFSENIQYTVYHGEEGGHYDWHVDHGPIRTRRKLSISVQLSDPALYDGCDLQLQAGNRIETAPRDRGMVIAFPSYVLHRVTPCSRGTRKAIVAWTTGPQFR
ncbi:MAG TPA: 2OG-Fe(II) oxygenase, partial [Rhizomicrobium sp.]|nr:2OG-Fe(II) oxygenase [Rhizomicrobium sp.]